MIAQCCTIASKICFIEDGEVVDLTKDDESDAVKDPDYEKVVLYHHKPTGYYYNPVSCNVICDSVYHMVVQYTSKCQQCSSIIKSL